MNRLIVSLRVAVLSFAVTISESSAQTKAVGVWHLPRLPKLR